MVKQRRQVRQSASKCFDRWSNVLSVRRVQKVDVRLGGRWNGSGSREGRCLAWLSRKKDRLSGSPRFRRCFNASTTIMFSNR
ncbi:MAG: hypothetical protein OXM56_04070, partial [Gammaproteobacteria bacterium]|nr:hypothetical protein [Gammaproteobacteria bacterium]